VAGLPLDRLLAEEAVLEELDELGEVKLFNRLLRDEEDSPDRELMVVTFLLRGVKSAKS
jgi:hypothetical protein